MATSHHHAAVVMDVEVTLMLKLVMLKGIFIHFRVSPLRERTDQTHRGLTGASTRLQGMALIHAQRRWTALVLSLLCPPTLCPWAATARGSSDPLPPPLPLLVPAPLPLPLPLPACHCHRRPPPPPPPATSPSLLLARERGSSCS